MHSIENDTKTQQNIGSWAALLFIAIHNGFKHKYHRCLIHKTTLEMFLPLTISPQHSQKVQITTMKVSIHTWTHCVCWSTITPKVILEMKRPLKCLVLSKAIFFCYKAVKTSAKKNCVQWFSCLIVKCVCLFDNGCDNDFLPHFPFRSFFCFSC